ncbi:tetratricopeptide repeat protein, partial [bacterium]
ALPISTEEARDEALNQAAAGEEKLAQSPAPNPALASRVAEDYLRGAEPAGAERVLTPLIEQGVGGAQPVRLRGTARYQQGDWSGAYEDAQRALEANPEDRYAQDLAGAARMMLSRLGLKAPRLKAPERPEDDAGAGPPAGEGSGASWTEEPPGPGDLGRWMTDIKRKVRIGDRQGALMDLTRLLGRDPRHLRALAQRAALLNRGPKPDPEAALLDADRALKLAPDDPEALRERAFALVQLGQAAEALPLLEKAIRLEPGSALGYLYRAKAYEALGRREEALADYQRAAALDPALRSFYEEALAGPPKAAPRAWPRPTAAQARGALFLLGVPLFLWGLWQAVRFVGRVTTRPSREPEPAAAPAAETLSPGTVLAGVYRVGGVLGRGGMGVVYEAEDLGLERRVALKQLRTPDGTPDDAARFLREARLVAKLSHPRIVQIHALVEEGGRHYMVFERVAGRTLAEELAESGRLGSAEVRAVVRDVCEALTAAHTSRVIHRDLKPGNVMRGLDGRCKVMDFGIARQASGGDHTLTEAWGTPPYMAPEQEQGRVGVESDLYALGCMSLELLTGARPFSGTADKLALRFRRPSEAGLPAPLDAFMEKALDPRPERRYRSAEDFRAAFEGSLS